MKAWHLVVSLFIFFMALFPFDFGGYDQAMNRTLDAGHFFAFGLLAYMIYQWLLQRQKRRPYLVATLSCFSVILLIEFVQPALGRSATLLDVWNSFAGVTVVLTWLKLKDAASGRLLKFGHHLVALGLLLFASYPALNAWYGEWWRVENFPVLGAFEHRVELVLWQPRGESSEGSARVRLSHDYVAEGQQNLRVETVPGDWSGVKYLAGRQSWEGYSRLLFSVYNPGEAFVLEFRIDDDRDSPAYAERFTEYLPIAHGENAFAFSVDEIKRSIRNGVLNIGAISKILFVCEREDPKRVFFLDGVKLTQ